MKTLVKRGTLVIDKHVDHKFLQCLTTPLSSGEVEVLVSLLQAFPSGDYIHCFVCN